MKKKVIIPTSLSEITLGQYQRYVAIDEPTVEDMLTIFLEMSKENLNAIADKDVTMIANELTKVLEVDTPFINRFSLRGTEYGFIPNLDDITYGENKDITTYINDWSTMHLAMAVMFRRVVQTLGSKYRIAEHSGDIDEELFKAMPLDVALGALVFFYSLTNELLKAIPNFLKQKTKGTEMEELIPLHLVTSMLNGLDSMKSIHLPKAI